MRRIIRIGKPTHFKHTINIPEGTASLGTHCGLIGPTHEAAHDPRDVDCINCMKTIAYREAMNGTEKGNDRIHWMAVPVN